MKAFFKFFLIFITWYLIFLSIEFILFKFFFCHGALKGKKKKKGFTACWPVLDTPHECSKTLPIIRHPTAHLVEFTPHAQRLCSPGSILQAMSCLSPPGAFSFTFLSSSCNHLIKAKSFLKHENTDFCTCAGVQQLLQYFSH